MIVDLLKDVKRAEIMQRLEGLERLKKLQCKKGTYDQGEYMRGMANGLILALATMQKKEPKYKKG